MSSSRRPLAHALLRELTELYHHNGVAFDPGDYETLIRQYETLSRGRRTGLYRWALAASPRPG